MTQKEKDFIKWQELKIKLTNEDLQKIADNHFEKEILDSIKTKDSRWKTFI